MRQRGVFWHHVFAGVLIGTGCVLPGVSGGVMAVSFGLYRPMLDAVLGFFRNAKRSFLFLLPIALGGSVGFLIAAKGLGFAMARFETPMLFLFAGFIIGGIPDLLREADAIAREELSKAGLDRDIWQCPVVLLADVHSVGVQGDERTYGSPIVLRPVSSEDAMTADWSRVPYDVLATISTRITNECRQINRVVLDCTSKPPATIEWE